jgi:DMSO/TMAO reductase YedYZ molybdopterin-dependent catalytic subunit
MTTEGKKIARRELLKLAPLLPLAGFGIPRLQRTLLAAGRESMGKAQAKVLRPAQMAPTFTQAELTPLANFPINSYLTEDPGVDLATWRLSVSGAVARPGDYSLEQIQSLAKQEQITRHICVEGWSVIGSFGGTRLADFLKLVGAAPDARFLEVECADDYYESLDIASALHSQTLLCYEMYGQKLSPAHGAPLRLQMPTKLGYKQAKHLVEMRVTRVLSPRRGYWVDQGYPAFGGL